jgi:hypothetical protein
MIEIKWLEAVKISSLGEETQSELAEALRENPQSRYDITDGKISRIDALKYILEWNGIIGYHGQIARWIDAIQAGETE